MRLIQAAVVMVGVSLGATASADATPAPASSPREVAVRVDELWKRRDDPAAFAQQRAALEQALAGAPADHDLLWRLGRWYAWKSDDPGLPKDERVKLGKQGWDLLERAVAINPRHAGAQFWAMAAMGQYALGLGIVRALTQGIEGKFRERLSQAERFDPAYAHGGIPVAWGGFYAKLPWPKYDEDKAVAYFRKALAINPANLRARVYWAELHRREEREDEARRLLQEVLNATPNKYDPPEERRCQILAARMMSRLDKR
jgi:tetratricopeptide (TPR) repeat protein